MSSVVTQVTARLLLAPILMLSFAILIKGFGDVGDGFSAGVIAALGILLQYVAFGRERVEHALPVRLLPPIAFVALLGALALAFAPVVRGDALMTHSPPRGESVTKLGTLELATAVALDAAIYVLVVSAVVGIIHAVARVSEEQAS